MSIDYRSTRTNEENAEYAARVRAHFAEKRSRGETSSPEETLDELARDAREGRSIKLDVRLAPEEKLRWAEAARALGLSTSEFLRDTANSAADEVLAAEPVGLS